MNRDELRAEIARKNIPKGKIAEELGISRSGLSLKLNGTNDFRETEIKILIKLLGLTSEDVDRIFLQ